MRDDANDPSPSEVKNKGHLTLTTELSPFEESDNIPPPVLSHRLPIQQKMLLDIPRDERIGTACNLGDIGDEFNYLLKWPLLKGSRAVFFQKYYLHHPNVIKFAI